MSDLLNVFAVPEAAAAKTSLVVSAAAGQITPPRVPSLAAL
jgi:hypothetical protein